MIEFFTIISGFIALLSVMTKVKRSELIFWSFILSLILFDGLRWEMGTDWGNYYKHFSVANVYIQPGFELGFIIYAYLIRSFTDNYSIYLFITTAFIYIGIFHTVFKMTNHSFLSLFFLTGHLPWYSGSLRQMMACVFFTLALKASMEKKLIKFLVLVTIGTTFHTTMIVFFPIYWLYGLPWTVLVGIFAVLTVLSVFSRNLIYVLDEILSYVSFKRSYMERLGGTLELSNPLLGFMRKISTITGLISFSLMAKTSRRMDKLQWEKVKFTAWLASLSLIFYYIGTYHITHVSSRLDIYTSIISTAVLIGLLDKSFKTFGNRMVLYFFVVLLVGVFYSRLLRLDLFHPYSSIFYNYDLNRKLF